MDLIRRLLLALGLAVIPLAVIATPAAANMVNCSMYNRGYGATAACANTGWPGIHSIQAWIKCTSNKTVWIKGNTVYHAHDDPTQAPRTSFVNCPNGYTVYQYTYYYT